MTNQQNQLVQLLLEQNRSLNASKLANALGVSVRTVHNYISSINRQYPGAILSTSDGYQIVPQLAREMLANQPGNIPQTAADRCNYILNRLLKADGALDLYDLCDEMFISTTTFHGLLGRMRRITRDYDLTLTVSSNAVTLTGSERNKRHLLSGLLYKESATSFTTIDSLQEAFPSIDIDIIRANVLDVLNEYHYFINDYSLLNLLLHIAIAINRIQSDCTTIVPVPQAKLLNSQEQDLAREVIHRLESIFHIQFSESEAFELALLLVSRASSLNYQSVTAENIADYIGLDCKALVEQLIHTVKDIYDIDLEEPEFYVRFALHIHSLLVRASNRSFCKNPLVSEIRRTCPLIYDVSVQLSGVILEQTGIAIDEDEIAYIALHLGGALETQKELASRIPAVLYCPNYYNMSQSLADRISRKMGGKIVLTNVITNENDLKNISSNVLAVCTIHLHHVWELPIVIISPFLTNTDCIAINRKIEEMSTQAKREKFRADLCQIMSAELFEYGEYMYNRESLIHHICSHIQALGYTDSDFESDVLEREGISSTAFGQFAIPHTLKMKSHRTGMAVYISRSPIPWGETAVNLVVMLSFNPNERKIFYDIFEPLSMILSDANTLKAGLACQTYEAFIDFLVEHLE